MGSESLEKDKVAAPKLSTKFNKALHSSQKVLGVEFAPINIPLERRKQTLGVLVWILLFFITGPGGPIIMYYFLFHTRLWILPVVYMIWIYLDRNTCNKGGRRYKFLRNWIIWKYYQKYFPINLIKTAELDKSRNYLLASHPHGILSSGAFCTFGTEANDVTHVFPGLTMHILTLPINFYLPLYREFCIGLGLCSAKKESMNYLLSYPGGGKGAVLIPGGAPESLESHPGTYVVQIKNKKGFIKVALQNGSPLVPIYSFGETEIFKQVQNPEGSLIRMFQNKAMQLLTFAPPIFSGRGIFQYNFGLLPHRRPINVVVGSPIDVQKISNPTQEDIDSLHKKYVEELTKLFNTYKEKYAEPDAQLVLI